MHYISCIKCSREQLILIFLLFNVLLCQLKQRIKMNSSLPLQERNKTQVSPRHITLLDLVEFKVWN
jgi:hypothetical protein